MHEDRPPWIKFHFADFFSDRHVQVMSNSQIGLYMRLLYYAWDAEPMATIPSDREELFQLSRSQNREEFDRDIENVLRCFRKQAGGKGGFVFIQKRMLQELEAYARRHAERVRSGKKGKKAQIASLASSDGSQAEPVAEQPLRASDSYSNTVVSNTGKLNKSTEGGPGETGLKIPAVLDAKEFLEVWPVWRRFRLGLKKPKNAEAMFQQQLNWLAPFGPRVAVQILQQSIRNGWQGLFELKGNGKEHMTRSDRNTAAVQKFLSKLEDKPK